MSGEVSRHPWNQAPAQNVVRFHENWRRAKGSFT